MGWMHPGVQGTGCAWDTVDSCWAHASISKDTAIAEPSSKHQGVAEPCGLHDGDRGVVLTPRSINSTSTNIHQHPCALQPAPPPPPPHPAMSAPPCTSSLHPASRTPGMSPGGTGTGTSGSCGWANPGGAGARARGRGGCTTWQLLYCRTWVSRWSFWTCRGVCVCVCGQQRGCVGVWVLEEQEGTWGWERWLAQQVVTQLSEWVCTSAQRVV